MEKRKGTEIDGRDKKCVFASREGGEKKGLEISANVKATMGMLIATFLQNVPR